jgi:hypothetical protein
MNDKEILNIFIWERPPEMSIIMLRSNLDPYGLIIEDLVDYLEDLELSLDIEEGEGRENADKKMPAKSRKQGRDGQTID